MGRPYPFVLHTPSNQRLEVGASWIEYTHMHTCTHAHMYVHMHPHVIGSHRVLVNMEVRGKVTPILNRTAWE